MTTILARRLTPPEHYDLARTMSALGVIRGDPTLARGTAEVWWATRTPEGPGTLHLARDGAALVATCYGAGAAWLVDRADAVAGLRDDLGDFADLVGRHERVRQLARVHRGLRMTASGRVFHHLVPAILGQKVTGEEAHRGYRKMLRHFAEAAPGPGPRLPLPPDPAAVAATPYWVFHPWGVEQRRADTVRRAAARAAALESAPDAVEATRRLTALPGIGAWTAAEVVRVAYGDADAVSVGDYHLPSIVAYTLAGEARADDARMLQLLEPFHGHRARVCRMIELSGVSPPRFGPRAPIRSFAHY